MWKSANLRAANTILLIKIDGSQMMKYNFMRLVLNALQPSLTIRLFSYLEAITRKKELLVQLSVTTSQRRG